MGLLACRSYRARALGWLTLTGGAWGLGYTRPLAGAVVVARSDERSIRSPWTPELSTNLMSILAPAVGAVLAAVLESSVFTHLQVGSAQPDLIFAVGIAIAMVMGFESGITWAFVGGISLDLLLPGRPLGSTTLTLLLVTGISLTVARALWPPRIVFIAATVFLLAFVYQGLLLGILTLAADVGFVGSSISDLILVAIVDTLIAVVAVVLVRALDLRFGEPERASW
jgi:rod shape-determining protein MreD